MNKPTDLDAARQREWHAQERALQQERLRTDPAGDDPLVAQYRLLARALRHPPLDAIPADFAAGVAARATARGVAVDDDRFETLLLRGLLIVLGLAAAVVVAIHGGAWLRSTLAMLPAADGYSADLVLMLLACIAASTIFELWHRERAVR